eukprot:m51a1_g7962 hypothetical protein (572) ;mRNA; r:228158-230977
MAQLPPSYVILALLLLLGCAAHASTCDQKRHADVGEFCGHGADGLYVCDPTTSYCNNQSASVSDWRCVALVAPGGDCTASEQCARHWEDAYCSEQHRCMFAWFHLGESCNNSKMCLSGACKNGVCSAPDYKTVGSACSDDGSLQCLSMQCYGHMCLDEYVQPVGAPCYRNIYCAEGICSAFFRLGVCLEPPPEMHIPCKGDSDCETAGRPGAYSCECDVKNKGWFCKRKWTMPDYTVGKCENAKGEAACEDLNLKGLAEDAKTQAYYMWMGDSSSAKRHADVGEFCGLGHDGLYVCDPTTSYCNNQSASVSDWRCVALVAPGGDCTASRQCQRHWEGAYCSEQHRCMFAWFHLGESCNNSEMCLSGVCKNGVCSIPDYKTVGSACSSRDSRNMCATGLVCDKDICTVAKPNGTACTRDDECLSGQCYAHMCLDEYVQPVGAPCYRDVYCALGICSGDFSLGVCQEPPPEMHIPCKSDSDCETAGRPGAYSCECDVKNKGWFCKRKWTMPDYTVGKCGYAKGDAACEDIYIKYMSDTVKAEAYYMWMGDSSPANRVALPAAVLAVLSFAQFL